MLKRRLILPLILALAAISTWLNAAPKSDVYSQVVSRIQQLKSSNHTIVSQIGTSGKGRPIYAVELTLADKSNIQSNSIPRIIILCGQHGNEPLPTYAALDLMQTITSGHHKDLNEMMKGVIITFIPVVNPDGFASGRRYNSNNADLNRNWISPNQPETIAVSSYIKSFKPHILVDEHEWVDDDPYRPNCVEVAKFGHDTALRFSRTLAYYIRLQMNENDLPLRSVYYRRQSDPRMAHRKFADSGICSLLIETSSDWSRIDRIKTYKLVVIAVIKTITAPPDLVVTKDLGAIRDKFKPSFVCSTSKLGKNDATDPFPTSTIYCLTLAVAVLIIARSISYREPQKQAYNGSRTRTSDVNRLHCLTEVVRYDMSVRARLMIMQHCKSRPTDRVAVKVNSEKPTRVITNRTISSSVPTR